MLFASSKIILLLTSQGLKVLNPDSGEAILFAFPPSVFHYLEILDVEEFKEQIASFLSKNSLAKKDFIIVLDQDVVFDKVLKHSPKLKEEIETFLKKVPLVSGDKREKILESLDKSYLFVTNKSVYLKIEEAIEITGGKLEAVVPVHVFGNGKPSQKTFDQVLDDKNLVRAVNFLAEEGFEEVEDMAAPVVDSEDLESEEEEKKPISKKQLVWLLIAGVGLILAVGFALVSRGPLMSFLSHASPTPAPVVLSSPSPTPVASSVASSSAVLKKDQLKVNVLNGSGISGQAGVIKDQLVEIGYKDITTGNAESVLDSTNVKFSTVFDSKSKEELVLLLSKTFQAVTEATTSAKDTFDLIITTGKLK